MGGVRGLLFEPHVIVTEVAATPTKELLPGCAARVEVEATMVRLLAMLLKLRASIPI